MMRKRTIVLACVYALVLVLTLSSLAAAQTDVYVPLLSASGTHGAGETALVSAAAAGGVVQWAFRGENATATFYSSVECRYRYVNVWVGDNVYREKPNAGEATSTLTLDIEDYDFCPPNDQSPTYTRLWGTETLDDDDFILSSPLRLDGATLDATVEVCDVPYSTPCPNPPSEAHVTLTWVGTGTRSSGHNHSNYNPFPGCRYVYRSMDTSRGAEVSGSIVVGNTDYTQDTTPFGYLNFTKSGSITQVGCIAPPPPIP